jgi:hypothetical protein
LDGLYGIPRRTFKLFLPRILREVPAMPNPRIDHQNPNTSIHDFVDRLSREGFYGALTLKYESGRLIHIRKEENLKPTELLSGTPENHVNDSKS